jgi:hypothetical protein
VLLVCIVSFLSGAFGCGYRFVGYDATQRDGEPRRIAVVTLENDSYEPGVELVVSQALRHEILGRGGLSLVDSGAAPDYTLRGRVLPVDTRSRSFTGDVLAREYEVTLRFQIRVDEAGGPGLDDAEFSAKELYLASADAAVLRKNRQEALRYLGGLLARRVHDKLDRELLGVVSREP